MGIKNWFLFLLVVQLFSCAQVRPLEGGPQDTEAPVPDMLKASPALGSTNVKPTTIRIPFSEYIKLNNASKNINVVPELPTKPVYEVRGRELVITIDPNELAENTTYSFIFNQAIADLNEGNDTTFTYVFSTGQYIDSLSHNVLLIDAESLSPIANAMVGLFAISDTLDPYTQKPRYLAPTNKLGEANFQFLGQQDFVVFAYDLKGMTRLSPDAPIAFRQDVLQLDTLQRTDTLFMFTPLPQEPAKGRILKKSIDGPGRITLVTNFLFSPQEILVKSGEQFVDFKVEETNRSDSSMLWIRAVESTNYEVLIPFQDTVLSAKLSLRKIPEKQSALSNNLKSDELGIFDTLRLTFDFPIQSINEQNLLVYQDSQLVNINQILLDNHRSVLVLGDFEADLTYHLTVLPNSIGFYDDSFFADSIKISFKRKGENKYANLELVLENKPEGKLILNLISGNAIVAQQVLDADQQRVDFKLLPPGEYMVQVVLDENENGQWDTGSWLLKQQPEQIVWFRQPITLRANWDTSQPLGFQEQ